MAPGWDNGGAQLVVAHCLNDPSRQCNSDSDCLDSSCSGSDPAEGWTGVCESHDALQVSRLSRLSCLSRLSSSLVAARPCMYVLPLPSRARADAWRASEQHGGAVKCYYKERFAANATGDYAVRCFTAKDPHGDRRYSSVPPLPSSCPLERNAVYMLYIGCI